MLPLIPADDDGGSPEDELVGPNDKNPGVGVQDMEAGS